MLVLKPVRSGLFRFLDLISCLTFPCRCSTFLSPWDVVCRVTCVSTSSVWRVNWVFSSRCWTDLTDKPARYSTHLLLFLSFPSLCVCMYVCMCFYVPVFVYAYMWDVMWCGVHVFVCLFVCLFVSLCVCGGGGILVPVRTSVDPLKVLAPANLDLSDEVHILHFKHKSGLIFEIAFLFPKLLTQAE